MVVQINKTIDGCLIDYTNIISELYNKGDYTISNALSKTYRDALDNKLKTTISIEIVISDV